MNGWWETFLQVLLFLLAFSLCLAGVAFGAWCVSQGSLLAVPVFLGVLVLFATVVSYVAARFES